LSYFVQRLLFLRQRLKNPIHHVQRHSKHLTMASHNVKFTLPERELGKVDARFSIYEDGKKLGEITISRGAIEYYPMNAQKPIKMSWTQVDRAMKEYN